MTRKEMLNAVIEMLNNSDRTDKDEMIDIAEKMIASITKQSGAIRKPSATQVENETIKDTILSYLSAENRPMTCSEIVENLGLKSKQKGSALLTALVNDNKVVRTTVKRVSYFTVA